MATSADDPYGVISVTAVQGSKAIASAGTPERLVAVDTFVEQVILSGRKNPATVNTGAVYVGFSAVAGSNYQVLLPGTSVVFPALRMRSQKKINLKDIYVDAATSADAVAYTAFN